MNRLLDLGLVTEMSEGQAGPSGGRRPIQLSINKDYGYIIGIEMQVEAYSVVAVNLAGEILRFKKEPKAITPETFIDDVVFIARSFAAEMGGEEKLIGVGIGMGGVIDSDRGIIHYSIPLHLSAPLHFSDTIAQRLNTPFMIGNDANCCAWGELAFHRADGLKNLYRGMVGAKNFFQSMVFLPQFLSTIVIGILWKRMFQADGPVSRLIQIISGNPNAQFDLMLRADTVMYPIGFALIWMYTGFYMVIFLANLQKVDTEMIEAAQIDGASEFQIFIRMIVPVLSGTVLV